jgi:hypothetical protein
MEVRTVGVEFEVVVRGQDGRRKTKKAFVPLWYVNNQDDHSTLESFLAGHFAPATVLEFKQLRTGWTSNRTKKPRSAGQRH